MQYYGSLPPLRWQYQSQEAYQLAQNNYEAEQRHREMMRAQSQPSGLGFTDLLIGGVAGYALANHAAKTEAPADPYRTLEQVFAGILDGDQAAEARLFTWEQDWTRLLARLERHNWWWRWDRHVRIRNIRESLASIDAFRRQYAKRSAALQVVDV